MHVILGKSDSFAIALDGECADIREPGFPFPSGTGACRCLHLSYITFARCSIIQFAKAWPIKGIIHCVPLSIKRRSSSQLKLPVIHFTKYHFMQHVHLKHMKELQNTLRYASISIHPLKPRPLHKYESFSLLTNHVHVLSINTTPDRTCSSIILQRPQRPRPASQPLTNLHPPGPPALARRSHPRPRRFRNARRTRDFRLQDLRHDPAGCLRGRGQQRCGGICKDGGGVGGLGPLGE